MGLNKFRSVMTDMWLLRKEIQLRLTDSYLGVPQKEFQTNDQQDDSTGPRGSIGLG